MVGFEVRNGNMNWYGYEMHWKHWEVMQEVYTYYDNEFNFLMDVWIGMHHYVSRFLGLIWAVNE